MSELAIIEPQAPSLDVDHWAGVLVFAAQLADKVHDTEFVPKALRGRPEAVAATIMYGAEVGVTPMQALAGIHIVEGRPSPSSELMRAMVYRAGHSMAVHESTGTRVRVSGLRRGRPESERVSIEWTLDMARAAGLLNKSNWRSHPRAMLTARAFGDLCRVLFPDVIKGLGYIAEDTAVDETLWGPPTTPAPELPPEGTRPALQRRRRKAAAEPATPAYREDTAELGPPVYPPTGGPPSRDEARVAEEARRAVEAEVAQAEARKPSAPAPIRDPWTTDVPLPADMLPTGTGKPAGPWPVMPDPEPEPPVAPEPPAKKAGPPLISPAPLKAINALLTKELGTAGTDEERHGLVAAILGLDEVPSLKLLTRTQGAQVLATFDRFRTGEAGWEFDAMLPAPGIRVMDLREPPEEDPA